MTQLSTRLKIKIVFLRELKLFSGLFMRDYFFVELSWIYKKLQLFIPHYLLLFKTWLENYLYSIKVSLVIFNGLVYISD